VELVGDAESILVKRSTSNLEAYMEYTQGRHFWRKRTTEGLVKSVEHFQSAIELDSSYALAYSGLADAYYILPRYTNVKYPEVKQKQLEAARTAVRLDDNSAEAHTSMAAYMKLIGDIDSAEVEFKRAIELSPCYSWAHLWYGNLLDESRNDPEGSESETRAALECDPLSIVALNNLAARESWKGNYDEAERLYNRIWEVEPTNSGLRINATSHYIRVGKLDEANSLFMKATELEPTTWWIYRLYADYLFHFGHRDKADSVYWNVIKVYPDQPVNYVNYGRFLKDSIQEYEGAIEQFRKAISLRPDDSPTYNQLAYSYYKIGKTDSALWAVNEAVELDTNCAECYQTKGVIYSELGILDSSLVAFRRSLEITPQWTTSMIGMGRAALLAGRWELADSLAEADANQDKAAHYRAFGRQRQALALAARGRFRESIQLFHENARADSIEFGNEWSLEEENARWFWYWNLLDIYKYYVRDPAAIEIAAAFRAFSVNSQWAAEGRPQWIPTSAGNLAYIYARVGEFDQAKMWLDTMRLDTDSSDSRGGRRLHFYHGAVALEQGEYDTAIAHLKIYGYTHMRGMAYLGAGQVKEAVKQFEWAVNHRATYRTSGWEIAISWCYYGLGRAYEADGQIEKAIAQYEIFLDLWKDADEDLKSVIDAKTRLERLKS
ncbi:MAG: tetratricopeptide repeat protein, partial [Candidatus Thorarchaeota archaeon]